MENIFIYIYALLGTSCAIIAVVKRGEGELDIKKIWLVAPLIAVAWPVVLGMHVGQVLKHGYYIKKKDEQPKE